jgi:hypothetical protein
MIKADPVLKEYAENLLQIADRGFNAKALAILISRHEEICEEEIFTVLNSFSEILKLYLNESPKDES